MITTAFTEACKRFWWIVLIPFGAEGFRLLLGKDSSLDRLIASFFGTLIAFALVVLFMWLRRKKRLL